jgi:cytochrome oxidase Cu insertion factor (SCO1/SenC/PrrC family)
LGRGSALRPISISEVSWPVLVLFGRNLLGLVLLGLILPGLVIVAPGIAQGKEGVSVKLAVDFELGNWDGKAVTLEKLEGKVVVLTFSYAFCSVSCPVITGRLASLDKAMSSPGDVVYLHVSIDPEMDTGERRKDYFGLYGLDPVKDRRWMFLSGQKDELAKLWDYYEVKIEKMENPMLPEGYFIKYSPRVMIIGKDGTIERETNFYFSEEDLATFIVGLL